MSHFKYSDQEKDLNKVLKMNLDISNSLQNDSGMASTRKEADAAIASSLELLQSLGKGKEVGKLAQEVSEHGKDRHLEHRPEIEPWEEIVRQANEYCPTPVMLEDIMSDREIQAAFDERDEIRKRFAEKTSILNPTDLSFLTVATALQVAKSLIFPYVAGMFHYGESFDPATRLAHNDKSIERAHRQANDAFRDKRLESHGTGHWINILYQTPPYDITKGSAAMGINMGGRYHRMYTLGHDPILGWLFGTMNILTDVITLNNFNSYRVIRKPKMIITPEPVSIGQMIQESYQLVQDDFLNLPAAVFAQARHFKSDEYTKCGLPVPILSSLNENFASKLYRSQYDALCFARDAKIVGASFIVSKLFDIVISLVHGLFCTEGEDKDLFECRTRKILLISNSIASTSTIIHAGITANPKNLDIGSLLNTITHLFTDIHFILRVKQEFIDSEISSRLQKELDEVDRLYETI